MSVARLTARRARWLVAAASASAALSTKAGDLLARSMGRGWRRSVMNEDERPTYDNREGRRCGLPSPRNALSNDLSSVSLRGFPACHRKFPGTHLCPATAEMLQHHHSRRESASSSLMPNKGDSVSPAA